MRVSVPEIRTAAFNAEHGEKMSPDLSSDVAPDEQERIERLWIEEIHRREQLRKDGLLQSRPVEEALADLDARLNAKYPPP
jgi:hypothetical protein